MEGCRDVNGEAQSSQAGLLKLLFAKEPPGYLVKLNSDSVVLGRTQNSTFLINLQVVLMLPVLRRHAEKPGGLDSFCKFQSSEERTENFGRTGVAQEMHNCDPRFMPS